jgi:hypothetical protein
MSTLKALLGILGALAAVACLLYRGAQPPQGLVPIAWDEEACAECRMHVGEPRFAAQLQTESGDVLNFDDPGCALRYLAREAPAVRALYFHHHKEETWLNRSQTAFVSVSPSPMGYNLAAAYQHEQGALSFEQAMQHVTRMERASAH